jgi:hypothetical protein
LKIQYREALTRAVQTVIRERLVPTPTAIRQLAGESANRQDVDAFSRLLTEAIEQLHEGSVARYRLKRSEFLAWKAMMNTSK